MRGVGSGEGSQGSFLGNLLLWVFHCSAAAAQVTLVVEGLSLHH